MIYIHLFYHGEGFTLTELYIINFSQMSSRLLLRWFGRYNVSQRSVSRRERTFEL